MPPTAIEPISSWESATWPCPATRPPAYAVESKVQISARLTKRPLIKPLLLHPRCIGTGKIKVHHQVRVFQNARLRGMDQIRQIIAGQPREAVASGSGAARPNVIAPSQPGGFSVGEVARVEILY